MDGMTEQKNVNRMKQEIHHKNHVLPSSCYSQQWCDTMKSCTISTADLRISNLMKMSEEMRKRTFICKWIGVCVCVSCMKGCMYFGASKGVFRISIIMLLASTFCLSSFHFVFPSWMLKHHVTMLPLSMELRGASYMYTSRRHTKIRDTTPKPNSLHMWI